MTTTSIVLCSLVQNALAKLTAEGDLENAKLTLSFDLEIPPVQANAKQLEKVIISLIRNSLNIIKTDTSDGALVMTVGSAEDQGYAMICIYNSECARQSPEFNPFGPSQDLAINRALIQAMGDELRFQPSSNPNAIFCITLQSVSTS